MKKLPTPDPPPPASEPPRESEDEDDPEEKSLLHGKLQLVYLALKVIEIAAALLRGCL